MKKRFRALFLSAIMLLSVGFSFTYGAYAANEEKKTDVSPKASLDTPSAFRSSSRTESSLKLRWESSPGADGYIIERKTGGSYIETGRTSKGTSLTVKELKSGKVYRFRLRAYKNSDEKCIYSAYTYLYACTLPKKGSLKSKACDNRVVTLTWKAQTCSGYQLQYSTKKDFSTYKSKSITDSSVTTVSTSKLSANTLYYFRLRAFVICNDKRYYSEPSEFSIRTDKGYKTTSKGYKIEEIKGITYVDGVLIANKTYSLPQSYAPGGLTKECNEAFNKMKSAASKDGVNLYIVSGFRSYETQKSLYNRYVAKDGKAKADTYSARPGSSEHQTGLAMDLNSLYTSFGDTKEGKWLAKNCYKYGFIIRYPKGKEKKTGYIYEPWHVRYLGKDTATKIYKSGLCLEEYYGITSKYN